MVGVDDGRVRFDRFDVSVGRLPVASDVPRCADVARVHRFRSPPGGVDLRAVVPVEVTVDISTGNRCGQRNPGHVASIRGLVEVSLADLAAGDLPQLVIPDRGDDEARVIVRFDDVRVESG